MKIVTGDIWEYPADVVCITTNGDVKRNGELVMGRGVARQAKQRYPEIPRILGGHVKHFGNLPMPVAVMGGGILWTFPVKHHWNEKADLDLIEKSARIFGKMARQEGFGANQIFVLPRPGCGNGGLDWEDVWPRIVGLLPDNVHVIDRA